MQLNENMEFMSRVSYSSVVGSLVHLMTRTHLNLAHVDIVVKYMANLGKEHWQIMKWIFWYLKGAKNSCLVYERYVGYVDSDYANDSQSPNRSHI
jgi:hypothetical protein